MLNNSRRQSTKPAANSKSQTQRGGKVTAKQKKSGNRDNEEMGRKEYEKELRGLQAELCKLQEWLGAKGLRVMVVFEGCDGAWKGGTIRAITERVSPGVYSAWVALPAPSDREKSQMYM